MDMEDGDWTEVAASSWPGVERDLDARSEIVDSSEISSSDLNLLTVIEDEADTRALVRRLQNQIEVLAALAHRPNSGLADRCATTVQSKVRMLACVRNQVPHILPARPNPKKEVLVLPFLAGGPRGMSSQKVCLIYVLAGHRDAAHAGRQPEQQDPV